MTTTSTASTAVKLDIEPLSGTIGGVIRASTSTSSSNRPRERRRQALLDYKVVFFPEQHLSLAEHSASPPPSAS